MTSTMMLGLATLAAGALAAVVALVTQEDDLVLAAAQFTISAVIALIAVLIYGELRRTRRDRERERNGLR